MIPSRWVSYTMDDVYGRNAADSGGFTRYDPWLENSPHGLGTGGLTHATAPPDGSTVDILLVERVVSEMLEAPFDEHVQYRGCWTLCTLVTHYQGGKNVLCAGGVEAVLGAMRAHRFNDAIQREALGMLEGIHNGFGLNHETEAARWILDIRDSGDTILSAMKTHQENLKIQHHGVGVFRMLQRVAMGDTTERDREIIEAVVAAMNTAPVDVRSEIAGRRRVRRVLEGRCVNLLASYAQAYNRSQMIWNWGGVALVIRCMFKHGSRGGMLLLDGCEVLGKVARLSLCIAEEVVSQGGVEAVLYAGNNIERSYYNDLVEWALAGLAATQMGVDVMLANGTVEIVVAGMKMCAPRIIQSLDKLDSSCLVLDKIACEPAGREVIVKTGGIGVALDVLRWTRELDLTTDESDRWLLPGKNRVMTAVCRLLVRFTDHEEAMMCIINKNGGTHVLTHLDSHGVEGLALLASRVLQGVRDTRARIHEKNISFVKGMYREDALPASMNPDLMRKILGFAGPDQASRTPM
jgi:hypothetical protein